jgi:hypothetical protein
MLFTVMLIKNGQPGFCGAITALKKATIFLSFPFSSNTCETEVAL